MAKKVEDRIAAMMRTFDDAMEDEDIRVRLTASLGLLPYVMAKLKPKEVEVEGVVETEVRRNLREEIQGIIEKGDGEG